MITLDNLVTGGIVFIVAYPFVYGLGYALSKGFHRGKREFVSQMVRDNCKKEG